MSVPLRYGFLLGCVLLLGLFLPATWELLRPGSKAVPALGETGWHLSVQPDVPSHMGFTVSRLASVRSQVQGEASEPNANLGLHSIPTAAAGATPREPAEAIISPALRSGR